MESVEERVGLLEGRVGEQSMRIDDVRDAVASLEARMDRRLEQLEQRMDQRFASVDSRFAVMDQRFLGIDGRLDTMNKLLWSLIIAVATGAIGIIAGVVAALVQG